MKREYVNIPEGQIHYLTEGEGEPLLMLHKTSLYSIEYIEVMPILSKYYRVIAMDTPGYGESDKPARIYSIVDYANSVINFLQVLDIKTTSIIGHLTGAGIAVEVAASRPEMVDKLVLIGCPYFDTKTLQERLTDPHHTQLEDIKEDGSHLNDIWQTQLEKEPRTKPINLQRTVLGYILAGPRAHDAHKALYHYEIAKRLPLIQSPTLLISGGINNYFNTRLDATKSLIPRCRTKAIEGVENLLPLEQPETVAEAIVDFLNVPKV